MVYILYYSQFDHFFYFRLIPSNFIERMNETIKISCHTVKINCHVLEERHTIKINCHINKINVWYVMLLSRHLLLMWIV